MMLGMMLMGSNRLKEQQVTCPCPLRQSFRPKRNRTQRSSARDGNTELEGRRWKPPRTSTTTRTPFDKTNLPCS